MRRLLAILFALPLGAAGPAAETARAIRENAFDRDECYRVRDLSLVRRDVRIYLADGYLIFGRPVMGKRTTAVFSADVEGGDGEVIVMPPNRGERRALASFIGSPNLDEHFRSAVFLGGDLYPELKAQMADNPANRRLPEMGAALEDKWAGVLRNLSGSYETRLTYDLLRGGSNGESLFAAVFAGVKHGTFDVIYDPRSPEQITVGQIANRDNRTYFDTWTSFESRIKAPRAALFGHDAVFSDYRIDAVIEPDLGMTAVTRVKVRPLEDGMRVIALDIARAMTVDAAAVDGRPAEVLQRESLRGNLGRGGNDMFLVAPAEPLRAGREYEFEFRHHGKVIHDAGDRVYYVSARGAFYPTHGLQYATYDLRFRYARDLNLVSAGEVMEDSVEGEWRTTRRRTQAPVRMAGFNLGSYFSARSGKGAYTVEVFANRSLERLLQAPQLMAPLELPQVTAPRARRAQPQFPVTAPGPSPAMHLRKMAGEIADAMEFMGGRFGAPALPFLTVSPIPGTFGQGFPGLIYLSTLTYLKGTEAAKTRISPQMEMFYSEILPSHEAAHQWWGNVVSAEGYHDYWLMEALANYSALLYLESRKGARPLAQALEQYRSELLQKNPAGQEVDAAGPIVLGTRLESSLEPRAWRAITYGKGSWIVHMLRRIMGDERFFRMLADLRAKYERKEISTDAFRLFAAGYLPPKSDDPKLESFFDQWVYNTGVPALRMTHSVRGKAPSLKVTGTITQSEVGDDFSVLVPVEIQLARGRSSVHWVRTANEPVEFTIPVRQVPLKVTLDPHGSVLRR